jgi:cyclase
VDELIVLDIDASGRRQEPDYDLIGRLAAECRMPLCYGGGVKTVEQVERIIELGVEKVAISSAAVENPQIVSRLAVAVGSQSVVVVLDVRKGGSGQEYGICIHNGTLQTGKSPIVVAKEMEALGAGEIVINAIDRDGLMNGYDLDLISTIREAVTLPMTVLGGAGSLDDLRRVIAKFGIVGAAAGSLFVFKGTYRAVLINYPRRVDKDALVLTSA